MIPQDFISERKKAAQAQRLGKETRRHIAASCDAIGFPLLRIGLF
jgi:hypothetical protein